MNFNLHQTNLTIGDFEKAVSTIHELLQKNEEEIHLFPELFICGYPLQDLVLQKEFKERHQNAIKKIQEEALSKDLNEKRIILFGGLEYIEDQEQQITNIFNVIYSVTPGSPVKGIYRKRLLPNYDIFDEKKYFSAGDEIGTLQVGELNFGLLICEDMWFSNTHNIDPVNELLRSELNFDGIINLSASPFFVGKHQKRITRAMEISQAFNCPLFYINRVGGEDEIQFDGSSFIIHGDSILAQGKRFQEDHLRFNLKKQDQKPVKNIKSLGQENNWESLFQAKLNIANTPVTLESLNEETMNELLAGLTHGLMEYAKKCGFKSLLVAVSGGIDSALVLILAKMTGLKVEAIYMPSIYSSGLSYDLSLKLCKNADVPLKVFPIKFLHSTVAHGFKDNFSNELTGLADENIQSRLRGAILYTRSNQTGSMVLNTSNKSELAVGYSTQYGDSVGAISPLGDLYKSEVFALSQYINQKGEVIPQEIIERPPTAELRENQSDQQSLPPYERLDAILEGILSNNYTTSDLEKLGHKKEEIEKTYGLYTKSEYKRNQFCPIIKVRAKSFGFGHRMPITAIK